MFNNPLVLPEYSEWTCYMFGSKPGVGCLMYRPLKGAEPNVFVRWMMKVCLACHWKKNDVQ